VKPAKKLKLKLMNLTIQEFHLEWVPTANHPNPITPLRLRVVGANQPISALRVGVDHSRIPLRMCAKKYQTSNPIQLPEQGYSIAFILLLLLVQQ
jgi:hypothetical protein